MEERYRLGVRDALDDPAGNARERLIVFSEEAESLKAAVPGNHLEAAVGEPPHEREVGEAIALD